MKSAGIQRTPNAARVPEQSKIIEEWDSSKGLRVIQDRLSEILTPPPRYNVREYADDRRYLSPESCSQPGKYRSSFAPFQRAPMEDATDPTVQDVTMMCASQLIKTTVLENVLGYFIEIQPAPILMVQPSIDLAESFSKERLVPMIRDTPTLKAKVREARAATAGTRS